MTIDIDTLSFSIHTIFNQSLVHGIKTLDSSNLDAIIAFKNNWLKWLSSLLPLPLETNDLGHVKGSELLQYFATISPGACQSMEFSLEVYSLFVKEFQSGGEKVCFQAIAVLPIMQIYLSFVQSRLSQRAAIEKIPNSEGKVEEENKLQKYNAAYKSSIALLNSIYTTMKVDLGTTYSVRLYVEGLYVLINISNIFYRDLATLHTTRKLLLMLSMRIEKYVIWDEQSSDNVNGNESMAVNGALSDDCFSIVYNFGIAYVRDLVQLVFRHQRQSKASGSNENVKHENSIHKRDKKLQDYHLTLYKFHFQHMITFLKCNWWQVIIRKGSLNQFNNNQLDILSLLKLCMETPEDITNNPSNGIPTKTLRDILTSVYSKVTLKTLLSAGDEDMILIMLSLMTVESIIDFIFEDLSSKKYSSALIFIESILSSLQNSRAICTISLKIRWLTAILIKITSSSNWKERFSIRSSNIFDLLLCYLYEMQLSESSSNDMASRAVVPCLTLGLILRGIVDINENNIAIVEVIFERLVFFHIENVSQSSDKAAIDSLYIFVIVFGSLTPTMKASIPRFYLVLYSLITTGNNLVSLGLDQEKIRCLLDIFNDIICARDESMDKSYIQFAQYIIKIIHSRSTSSFSSFLPSYPELVNVLQRLEDILVNTRNPPLPSSIINKIQYFISTISSSF